MIPSDLDMNLQLRPFLLLDYGRGPAEVDLPGAITIPLKGTFRSGERLQNVELRGARSQQAKVRFLSSRSQVLLPQAEQDGLGQPGGQREHWQAAVSIPPGKPRKEASKSNRFCSPCLRRLSSKRICKTAGSLASQG
jgi:hypothetical protein